jgi:hypothetical protein
MIAKPGIVVAQSGVIDGLRINGILRGAKPAQLPVQLPTKFEIQRTREF